VKDNIAGKYVGTRRWDNLPIVPDVEISRRRLVNQGGCSIVIVGNVHQRLFDKKLTYC
jgi:hypothetical protein